MRTGRASGPFSLDSWENKELPLLLILRRFLMCLFALLVGVSGVFMRLLRVLDGFVVAALLVKFGCTTMRFGCVFVMFRCFVVNFVCHKTSSGVFP
jgi:hypothetical protein